MSETLELQRLANVAILTKDVHHFMPHSYALSRLGVAEDVHAMLRSRKEDVDPVWRLEKARLVLLVAADE